MYPSLPQSKSNSEKITLINVADRRILQNTTTKPSSSYVTVTKKRKSALEYIPNYDKKEHQSQIIQSYSSSEFSPSKILVNKTNETLSMRQILEFFQQKKSNMFNTTEIEMCQSLKEIIDSNLKASLRGSDDFVGGADMDIVQLSPLKEL
ncbi:hypothetical protein WA026_012893 [Henosepilachna vigintioctopunctata]|uniref:Uncharacterized protein n=1 Tax=Henosepilachna vigintioctopunctata TaxID=420089 RepID=A0AAW1TT78_9CUCU